MHPAKSVGCGLSLTDTPFLLLDPVRTSDLEFIHLDGKNGHIACRISDRVSALGLNLNLKQAKKNPVNQRFTGFSIILLTKLGAQERTRTSTPLRALGPEPSASTNSATWAKKTRILKITSYHVNEKKHFS